jgi:hypothetical protein
MRAEKRPDSMSRAGNRVNLTKRQLAGIQQFFCHLFDPLSNIHQRLVSVALERGGKRVELFGV